MIDQRDERLDHALSRAALRFSVELHPAARATLTRYAAHLLAWNERINLSGARDLGTLASEHLADALALAPHLPSSGRCLDVGSGAGLPGFVLAVLRPDLAFTLLEPIQKRRAFLASMCRELNQSNVSVSGERLEAHAVTRKSSYDFAVSRAVFPLSEWLERGAQMVRAGGVVAGLAGGSLDAGLPAGSEWLPYDVGAGPRAVILVRDRSLVPRGTIPVGE